MPLQGEVDVRSRLILADGTTGNKFRYGSLCKFTVIYFSSHTKSAVHGGKVKSNWVAPNIQGFHCLIEFTA